jgi:hypothetical protein
LICICSVSIDDKHAFDCRDAKEELHARLVNAGGIRLNKLAKPGGSTLGSVETTAALLVPFRLHNIVSMGTEDIWWFSARGSKGSRDVWEHGAGGMMSIKLSIKAFVPFWPV